MITLGGNVCVRNGIELDYCWREAVASLLPVCDTVTVCDGSSTDWTQEEIREWMAREPRILLCVYPWPNPKGDIEFWVKWINYAREHVKEDFQFQLDADEILSEKSYPLIEEFKRGTMPTDRVSLRCLRYNFWQDPQHLIPHGVCCGHQVVRVAPTSVWLPSDGSHPSGAEANRIARDSQIELFHYGFLRRREAYFEKTRQLHTMFFGGMTDSRIIDVEKNCKGNWMQEIQNVEWLNRLRDFTGQHPAIALPWLKERGYV